MLQKRCADCGIPIPKRMLRKKGKEIISVRASRCAFCRAARRKDARAMKREAMRP